MKSQWSCAAVARQAAGRDWAPVLGDREQLAAGDRLLVGGLLLDVLRLAQQNSPIVTSRSRWLRAATRVRKSVPTDGMGRLILSYALALLALFVVTAVVFAIALGLGPVDAGYRALTNAFGDVSLSSAPEWLKVFGITVMVLGAVLIGIVLAHVTATLTANRLEQQAGRRARRLRGHVVIAGLGMLGFRVDRLLDELGIATVIIERQVDLSRFGEAAAFRTPVLSGDARLKENLERAGIGRASAIIACTDNDLVNVSACVEAHRISPEVRTIARIFDDDLAEQLASFGIDTALSMSRVAATAFIGAATGERALRWIALGELELGAFRHQLDRPVASSELAAWRERGLRVVAVHPAGGAPLPPSAAMGDLAAHTEIIVVGPPAVLEECLFGVDRAAGSDVEHPLAIPDRVVSRPTH
jgi:Trk K+ transport system NAD-binding subunit